MGTRSLTHFKSAGKDSATLATIYRQYDGYLEGHGAELASFLASKTLVNGFQKPDEEFNGIGCAAAQVISHLKGERAGQIYIQLPDAKDCDEEYTYTVYVEKGVLCFRCDDGEVRYDGPCKDFAAYLCLTK